MEYDERDKMRDMISGDAENVENVLEWYIIRQALQSYPCVSYCIFIHQLNAVLCEVT